MLFVAGLCFFAAWHPVGDAAGAYTLSRGRQVLLDRGLQVQAYTYTANHFHDVNLWVSAGFNTINTWETPSAWVLAQLPPEIRFAREYYTPWPETKYLSPEELPYAGKLVAYQYDDELNDGILDILPEVRDTYIDWRARYNKVLAYTNFSSGITTSQIATYMNATQPDMLMFDCYPVYFDHDGSYVWSDRKIWYRFMGDYRDLGLMGSTVNGVNSGPLPYAQFLNLYHTSYSDPLPDESFIRLQQNASWAFGFTYVTGYSYNYAGYPSVLFSNNEDTNPTVVFDYVAEANRQSRNLGPALVRLVSANVYMIGGTEHDSRPSNIPLYTPGAGSPYITNIRPYMPSGAPDPDYSDILIGFFEPLLDDNPNCTFVNGLPFMIVNGATGGTPEALAQTYLLTFDFGDSGYDSLVRLDRDTGQVAPVELEHTGGSFYRCLYSLEGGTGDLFGYWNSSTPLPTIPEPGTLGLLTTGLLGLLYYAWRRRK